jgi:predicted transcriptional regulator
MYATEHVNDSKFKDVSYILKQISDDRALILFNQIAISNGEHFVSLKEMNLTTKQYYSRISGLTKANLVRRHKGKYSLTLLGKIVYDAHLIIGKALNYYWKLNAIESIQTSSNGLPKEEILKLVDALIDNHQVKEVITKLLVSVEDIMPLPQQQIPQSGRLFEKTTLAIPQSVKAVRPAWC